MTYRTQFVLATFIVATMLFGVDSILYAQENIDEPMLLVLPFDREKNTEPVGEMVSEESAKEEKEETITHSNGGEGGSSSDKKEDSLPAEDLLNVWRREEKSETSDSLNTIQESYHGAPDETYKVWVDPKNDHLVLITNTPERLYETEKTIFEYKKFVEYLRETFDEEEYYKESEPNYNTWDEDRAGVFDYERPQIQEYPPSSRNMKCALVYAISKDVDSGRTHYFYATEMVLFDHVGLDITVDGYLTQEESMVLKEYQRTIGAFPTGRWDAQTTLMYRKLHNCTRFLSFSWIPNFHPPKFLFEERVVIEPDGMLRIEYSVAPAYFGGKYGWFDKRPKEEVPVPAETKPVVVFVPGMYGSDLYLDTEKGVEKLWVNVNPLTKKEKHKKLTLDETSPNYQGDNVWVKEVGWSVLGFGVYQPLRDAFKDAGYTEADTVSYRNFVCADTDDDADFYPFAYDWRKSNVVSGQQLKEFVECISTHQPDRSVIIVAHSMGGFVTQHYMQRLGGGEYVDKVITLGTPWLGAVSALNTVLTGDNINLPIPGFELMSRDIAVELAKDFDSAMQLLPNARYFEKGNRPLKEGVDVNGDGQLDTPEKLSDVDTLFTERMGYHVRPSEVSAEFHDGFVDSMGSVPYYVVSGNTGGGKTVQQLISTADRCRRQKTEGSLCNKGRAGVDSHWRLLFGAGDGTVNKVSAEYPWSIDGDVVAQSFPVDHVELVQDEHSLSYVLNVLEDKKTEQIYETQDTSEQTTFHYVTLYGVTSFEYSDNATESVLIDRESGRGVVPVFWLSDDVVTVIVDPDSQYAFSFPSGNPFDIFVEIGQEDSSEEYRFLDIDVGEDNLMLEYSEGVPVLLGEQEVVPVVVSADSDKDAPVVSLSLDNGDVVAHAQDASDYTLYSAVDEGEFDMYVGPIPVSEGQTVHAFAEDVFGNVSTTVHMKVPTKELRESVATTGGSVQLFDTEGGVSWEEVFYGDVRVIEITGVAEKEITLLVEDETQIVVTIDEQGAGDIMLAGEGVEHQVLGFQSTTLFA